MGLGGGGVFCPGSPVFGPRHGIGPCSWAWPRAGIWLCAWRPVPSMEGGTGSRWRCFADSVSGLCGERGSWMERGLLAHGAAGLGHSGGALGFERLRRRAGLPDGSPVWSGGVLVPGSAFCGAGGLCCAGSGVAKSAAGKSGGQWNRRGDYALAGCGGIAPRRKGRSPWLWGLGLAVAGAGVSLLTAGVLSQAVAVHTQERFSR